MLKKSGLILLFALILILLPLSFAQNSSNASSSLGSSTGSSSSSGGNLDKINKAYQCLESKVKDKDPASISLQEAVFGVLALGSNSKLTSVIDNKIVTTNHWSESGNQMKDTAQALLAYNRIGKNTDAVESWILGKKQAASDLTWYLEIDIDNHESSECNLGYSNENQRTVTVNQDMTLSGNPGSCLTISQGGFWLKVSNNCIDYNFTISCDKDFTTSTLYQRTGSTTVFVSSVAHSASGEGSTVESIKSKCLSSSTNACDYEGTLWAALALDKTSNSVEEYLPYLLALSESNRRFLPSSFLHILTDGQDQYSELVQSQQSNQFWQAPNTPYNRYYDSALAILSLQGTNSIEQSNSKTYFEGITAPDGCWNNDNLRDTAFLLYAGWPRFVSGTTGGSSGGSGSAPSCESAGNTCTSVFTCKDLGGTALEDYLCPGTRVCCSESVPVSSCLELKGSICLSSESCSGSSVDSSDGSCCLGTCSITKTQTNECQVAGGACYPSCNGNEEQIPSLCSDGNVCCKAKASSSSSSSSSLGLWITLLVILIAVLAFAIIYRNRIKMLLFKSKSKGVSEGQLPRGPPSPRPPFPPSRGPIPYPRAQPRMVPPQGQPIPVRKPMPSKDKDMEDTMAKLREMSK